MTKTLRELAETEVSELLHRGVSVFDPGEGASRALGELKETKRYEAVVSSGERYGLVTVRDLLKVDHPERTKIEGLWRVLGPASPNSTVLEVDEALIRNNVRALPVVENREVVGIISQVDIAEALCDVPEISGIPAKELMRRPVLSLDINERVAYARRLMLEKGFSHVPIVEYNRLVGMVTAGDIVHAFITPAAKTTTGERAGEKVTRFPGAVAGVMDRHPFTVGPDASALEVACGLGERGKSACMMVNRDRSILGIITPRELNSVLLRLRLAEELPVYILGLTEEEGFFERAVAEEKVRRIVNRSMKLHPQITEASVRIKRQQKGGQRARYQAIARVLSPEEQFIAQEEGWDLLSTFDRLCETLDKTLRKAKQEPERDPRRRRGRR